MPEAVRRQQISKNMEGLTIADVMALQRRDYGYGDGYCYHRGGRGMAAFRLKVRYFYPKL